MDGQFHQAAGSAKANATLAKFLRETHPARLVRMQGSRRPLEWTDPMESVGTGYVVDPAREG